MSFLSKLKDKKLGLVELISLGYHLYFKNIRLFLGFNFIALPFIIISNIISAYSSSNLAAYFLLIFYSIFYFFVFFPFYIAAISILVEDCVLNKQIQPKNVIKRIGNRIFSLVALYVIFSFNFFVRSLLLIIPGIIYFVNNFFFDYALILRDQTGKSAFQYSRLLVKGNWWRLFFYSFIVNLTIFGTQIIVDTILNSIFVDLPLLTSILSAILLIFATFGISISGVLLFLNLEFQKS